MKKFLKNSLCAWIRIELKKKPLLHCLLSLALITLAQTPPGYEFKTVTWRDKNILNVSGLSQAASGDEWWFSHKNAYDGNGKHIGYVAVGYIAEFVTPSDLTNMRAVFNEGSDSPHNDLYPTSPGPFTFDPANGKEYEGECYEFYDNMDRGPSTNGKEMRTAYRGIVALLDLTGKMVWCRVLSINGDGLQELVVDGNDIYVVGNHDGAKDMKFQNGNANRGFIIYNPNGSNSSHVFDRSSGAYPSIPVGGNTHMYVAKLDLMTGNIAWQGLYGYPSFSGNEVNAWNSRSSGMDILINSGASGDLFATGTSRTSPSDPTQVFLVRIAKSTGYVISKNLFAIPTGAAWESNHSKPIESMIGKTICQTSSSGSMVIGGVC
jgi:hypothetical protein